MTAANNRKGALLLHGVRPAVVDNIDEAATAHDWWRALQFADSVSKFEVFLTLAPEMTLEERRTTLAAIWTVCDGAFWVNRKAAIGHLRDVGYIGDLRKPADQIVLYRGTHSTAHRLGICWSSDRDRARWFVRPGGRGPSLGGFLYTATAPPEAILAGFDDRQEAEYVVDPALLERVRRLEVVPPDVAS